MKKRVNSNTLAPLLEVARTDPDAGVRGAALDAASRLPLSEEAWRALAQAVRQVATAPACDSAERTTVLALAARVPLLSVRRMLRAVAADAADPAREAVSRALVTAGDPVEIRRCRAATGREPLAGGDEARDDEASTGARALLGRLPPSSDWPIAELLAAQLGAAMPALADDELAWVLAHVPPAQWIGPLVALVVPPSRPVVERLRAMRIAIACARRTRPDRGPGADVEAPGAAPSRGRGVDLIDDEPHTAGAEPGEAGLDTLSVGMAGPRAAPPAAPTVPCGDAAVFCPPVVARDTVVLLQVMLYGPDDAGQARAQALEADPSAHRRAVLALPPDLPSGTRIDLRLEMPALRVDEADAALVWTGRTTAVQFAVSVPADAKRGNTIGRVRLAVAGLPIGTLVFQVGVVAEAAAVPPPRDGGADVRRYRRAFVSYCSADRAEVLRRVQAFRIAGLSVFQDVLDLEPGDRWERGLYREIDCCDVVLLFWSKAAAASEWVLREIAYALARQHGDRDAPPAIAPVPIEGPPIVPPPPGLEHLHFNDALLAHIAVASAPPKP